MDINKINELILNYKDKPNKQLLSLMDILNKEFEETKFLIVDLTKHLDNIQNIYNEIDKEYNLRVKK